MSAFHWFMIGLFNALSWENGMDNVIIGAPPSWTYVLGLVANASVFCWGYAYLINRYRQSSERKLLYSRMKEKKITGFIACLLLLGGVYYTGYRLTNGLWRYHYFTSQTVQEEQAIAHKFDTYIGGYRSNYSSVEMMVAMADTPQRPVHISNSTKSMARAFQGVERLEYNLLPVKVKVRLDRTIVFLTIDSGLVEED